MSSEIADLSTVSPQCTFLESHPQPPQADSTLYLTRSATDNISGGRDHTIVGVQLDQLRGQFKKSQPSKGAEDALDFILGAGSGAIRQKIARPPFWSCLDVRVRYVPALQDARKPRITRLLFTLSSDVTPAPDRQSVLMVHPLGVSPGAVVACSPKDLAGRDAGLGHFMRIYDQGATVQLSVPAAFGADFNGWQLIGTGLPSPERISTPDARVKLKDDVTAQCSWGFDRDPVARFELTPQQLSTLADTHPNEDVRKSLQVLFAVRPPVAPGADSAIAKLIRVAPDDRSSVVGWVHPEGTPDLLQEGKDGWREVNYRGVAGWVRA